jgi:hypothetical protein
LIADLATGLADQGEDSSSYVVLHEVEEDAIKSS